MKMAKSVSNNNKENMSFNREKQPSKTTLRQLQEWRDKKYKQTK